MRMPRLRLWMLLAAILVLACGLGGYREWETRARGERYRRQAVFHAAAESNLRLTLEALRRDEDGDAGARDVAVVDRRPVGGRFYANLSRKPGSKDLLTPWDYERHPIDLSGLDLSGLERGWDPPAYHAKYTAACERLAAYHALMRRKYERAASHPWEALDPDPPAPTLPSSTMPIRVRRPFPRPPAQAPDGRGTGLDRTPRGIDHGSGSPKSSGS
jgi:hypothetical protein